MYCSPTPVLKHVCSESRSIPYYEKAFTGGADPRYTWINFGTDIVDMDDMAAMFLDRDLCSLRRMRSIVLDIQWFVEKTLHSFGRFTALDCLWLISYGARSTAEEDEEPEDDEVTVVTFARWGEILRRWPVKWGCPAERAMVLKEASGEERALTVCFQQAQDKEQGRDYYLQQGWVDD